MKLSLTILLLLTSSFAQVAITGNSTNLGNITLDAPVVTVSNSSPLTSGTVGTSYGPVTLTAGGGSGTYVFTITSGSLPAGLSLATPTISGTPTSPGTICFSVVATDSNGVVSTPKNLCIAISSGATLTINNTSFPNFPFSQAYSQAISVTGGTGTGYVCSIAAGGTGLPAGVTVSSTCTVGLTATSVGGTVGNTYTFALNVVDSGSNTFTSGLFSAQVIQPCGPPNYGCAGRAVANDNCVMQIFGGPAAAPGCPPTPASIPNLNNGSSTCTQGTNCTTTDPQYNNIEMTRCTDAQLNGLITSGTFFNRTYNVGNGGSGDANDFTTDSSLMAIYDTGNRFIIESIDTAGRTCYPVLNGSSVWLPGPGEFSSKTKGNYFAFFKNGYTVVLYAISCATPGQVSHPCAAPGSSTIKADFSTVFPGVTATPWAATTSYNYGQYVYVYMTNSQSSSVTAASCAANVITYTISPALGTLSANGLVNVSGLSTYNGTALLLATANPAGTTATVATTCVTGTATGTGTITEGSNVLFQDTTSGTHVSGSTAPNVTGALNNFTDSGITWINAGTTNFTQGGGWTTIGGVSTDETQFSGGFSNNNFDKNAKGAENITMNGNQNTGFYVDTYDATADLYYEYNTGSGIVKSFACTASSGPQCTRGTGGITVIGQINVTSTVPCGSTPCQFYIHNVKIFKGGTWNIIDPEYCQSNASGPGNCSASGRFFWSKGTTTSNMAIASDAGHSTERFTHQVNFGNSGSAVAQIRTVTASNTVSAVWTNPNISYNFDGHWGWYYLNGSTSDATTTPIGGTTMNTYDFPYTSPFESEVLVVPTCGVSSGVTTPNCSAGELQNSQIAREGHTYATGSNNVFNPQYAIPSYSQDGRIIAVSTDWACQFGSTNGGSVLCGFPWSTSYTYASNAMIQPTWPSTFKSTNNGGFVYQNQAGTTCTSGTTQPTTFAQIVVINGAVTSVANASGGTTVYNGTFPGGASNAFKNYTFNMSTFSQSANNGTFTVTASTATTLTVNNASGVSDTSGLAYGPQTPDGGCQWVNVGVGNGRGDVVLYWLQ